MKKRQFQRIGVLFALLGCLLGTVNAAQIESLIPLGRTVGVKMNAQGALVIRLSEVQNSAGNLAPARDAGLVVGDLIVSVNGVPIDSNDALQKQVSLSAGRTIELTLERAGQTLSIPVTPCADQTGTYRIGVLARDSMAGIGTLTYVDPETGAYGSLGHGICESETGVLLPLKEGTLIYSVVGSVQQGKAGEPGALRGQFSSEHLVGTVTENSDSGIFGVLTDELLYQNSQRLPVAKTEEIQIGKAEILANIEGDTVERYTVDVVKLYPSDDEYGRSMMIHVTDPRLLEKTGGIVQGMSGSPLLQNGKIIGAVTHVLVNDPTSGYAISIAKMLEEMTN